MPIVAEDQVDFLVVVHESNPASEVKRSKLAKMFVNRAARWDEGLEIVPVDQSVESPVRAAFSEVILGKSVRAIKNFWVRAIFSGGSVPPKELQSDQAVLAFIQRERGAVGYVSVEARLESGVRVLEITDLPGYPPAPQPSPALQVSRRVTVSEQGYVHLDLTSSCGFERNGRRVVLGNSSPYETVQVTIEATAWGIGSDSEASYVLLPQEEKVLGCTRPTEDAEWQYSIVAVSQPD